MELFAALMAVATAALVGAGYLYVRGRGFSVSASPSALSRFTRDLTAAAREGTTERVVGRDREIARVIEILARRTKNNPLLLGEPGVGKTAIVEGLAARIAAGAVPFDLKNKRLLALDLVTLISDTKYRGELEGRLKAIVEALVAANRHIVVFIDEVHMLAQTKGAEGALSVADVLKPALARGELQVIGATTPQEYEQFIGPDETLARRFQPILVPEPDEDEALRILHGIKSVYEDYHCVRYTDAALKAAVRLSGRFENARFLPDRAIDLLDEAGARVKIESSDIAGRAVCIAFAAGAKAAAQGPKGPQRPEVREEDVRSIVDEQTELSPEPSTEPN